MNLLIYANLATRKPESTLTGAIMNWPDFTAGDKVRLSVRFLDMIENARVERMLPIKSARLSLGLVDTAPTAGTWRIKIGAGASTVNNTTPPLPANIYPSTLAASLNALPVVSGPLSPATVEQIGASWILRFGAGAAVEVTVPENKLEPEAFARVRQSETNGQYDTEIRLLQAPLASTSTFQRIVPPSPEVTTLQEGNTDPSGTYFVPEIQKITVPALFRGTWQLFYNDTYKSRIFGTEEAAEDIQSAINEMLAPLDYRVSVLSPAEGEYLIIFDGANVVGVDVEQMEAIVFDAPEGDVTFDLDLNTREVFRALAAVPQRQDCVIELEADIAHDGENPNDPASPSSRVTLFQSPVKLRAELQWDALAAAANVDWLRPPTRRSYIPFTLSQVLTGQQQAFQTVLGDGEATQFVLDHDLHSSICQIIVRENIEDGRLLRPDEYEVTFSSEDSLTITFPDAPASNEYAVQIVAVGPPSVFQAHTHTMAEVEGLNAFLSDIVTRVTNLETILPTVTVGVAATGGAIEIPIPAQTEALFYRGGEKLEIKDGELPTLPRRAPYMLPAIHTTSNSTSLSDPLPDPTQTAAGTLWINDSGNAVLIPGGGGQRSAYVADDGFVGCDARVLYPASRDGTTTSYYPTAFERELFAFFVSEKMLATRRMELVFGLGMATIGATSRASWVLEIQAGTAPQDTSPATTGPNLQNVLWNATPILRERLVITQEMVTHTFGVRIKNTLDGMVCDVQNYGLWTGNNAAAPGVANFALRARLINFDTENSRPDARGWVLYQLGAVKGTGEDGGGADKLKAIIV